MEQILERIATWEDAGLIDPATAARLRLAEAERAAPPAGTTATQRGPSSLASIFGPGVTIGEMFAYLGGAFLLGAYETFIVRMGSSGETPELPIAFGSTAAAIALGLAGRALLNGDARRRRAAGVMLALAVAQAGVAAGTTAAAAGLEWPVIGVLGALVATLAGIRFRLLHPSLLTQVALLVSGTALAGLSLNAVERLIVPERQFTDFGEPILDAGSPDPVLLVVISAAWWLGVAVIVGFIGLREAATADEDPAAGRRASLTRLWAGLVAVVGLAVSITRSDYTSTGEFKRPIEPWVGELALLVLAAILVERAFRRDASTFVYAAALAVIIALTDFNFTYLSSSTEIGLLIEGVILLGAGVAADRLRRRIGQPEPQVEVAAPTAPA